MKPSPQRRHKVIDHLCSGFKERNTSISPDVELCPGRAANGYSDDGRCRGEDGRDDGRSQTQGTDLSCGDEPNAGNRPSLQRRISFNRTSRTAGNRLNVRRHLANSAINKDHFEWSRNGAAHFDDAMRKRRCEDLGRDAGAGRCCGDGDYDSRTTRANQ